jgi:hypothetical protein
VKERYVATNAFMNRTSATRYTHIIEIYQKEKEEEGVPPRGETRQSISFSRVPAFTRVSWACVSAKSFLRLSPPPVYEVLCIAVPCRSHSH